MTEDAETGALPHGLGRPAERALAGAGIRNLSQLTGVTAQELLSLHGFGPRALSRLKEALAAHDLELGSD